jgi:hypothetical protein
VALVGNLVFYLRTKSETKSVTPDTAFRFNSKDTDLGMTGIGGFYDGDREVEWACRVGDKFEKKKDMGTWGRWMVDTHASTVAKYVLP